MTAASCKLGGRTIRPLRWPARASSMNLKDYIGKRGEIIFCMLITKWCEGEPWLDVTFLGEKAETKDFMVNLIEPASGDAPFYVQVKATTTGYTGTGPDRKLNVKVTKEDVEKLKHSAGLAYVVGVDIQGECGYLMAITKDVTGAISGIPTKHRINCDLIKKLWKEVDNYWKARKMLPRTSQFSV